MRRVVVSMQLLLFVSLVCVGGLFADPPSASYIFPAGGQRGTTVNIRIGGHFLYDRAAWEMAGLGVKGSDEISLTKRIWFEGPVIKQPASQQKEDYPQDYAASVQLAPDAIPGNRTWRTWNAQGITPGMRFVVGNLPEVVEQETDGQPIPTQVSLPVTINGRIFPREDVDVWTFDAVAGQSITCSVEATSLMSPTVDPQQRFEPLLEIRDASNRVAAVSVGGLIADPQLRFKPAESGRYQARIWDSRAGGLQHYVYRLTVTAGPWIDAIYPLGGKRGMETEVEVAGQGVANGRLKVRWPDAEPGIVRHAFDGMNPVLLDIDNLPEVLEPAEGTLPVLPCPAVANGRIEKPGDVDAWPFTATKGSLVRIEIRAARFGSPLDGVLVIKDSQDKELARAEDLPNGSADCELDFNPPADGQYVAEVQERFASRGGREFAYRLLLAPQSPDFRLGLAADSHAVVIGGEAKLPVTIERRGGFNGPIKFSVTGLPAGATCAEIDAPANQNRVELVVKVAKDVPVQLARLMVIGNATLGDAAAERKATFNPSIGEPAAEQVLLACTLATPFKFKSQYEFRYVPRGGSLKKGYTIERNGFEGPLEVSLADRQGRHLQGITGPTITVPAGTSTFEYAVGLPPWMELGRTSRTNLMMVGELADSAGKKHKVSFSTVEQNEQLIALVSPGPLRLSLEKSAILAKPGSELVVPIRLHRQVGLASACMLEFVVPAHMRDISAAPVEVAANAETAELKLILGNDPGPFNMPLVIRGVTDHNGGPIVAEVGLELLMKSP